METHRQKRDGALSAPPGLAHHEAAHCIALAFYGWTIRSATIIPEGPYAGLVRHDAPPPGDLLRGLPH